MCGASFMSAQDNTPPPQDGPSVKTTVKIYKWAFSNAMSIPTGEGGVTSIKSSSEAEVTLWYKTGSDWKSIVASSGSMSKTIPYEGPQKMVFYSRADGADGTPKYKEACSMMIPLGADELFAMMFKRGSMIRFYPMNVSPTSLPKEKVAIINMTSHTIAIMASGVSQYLKSGTHAVVTPKRKDNFSVDLQIAKQTPNPKIKNQVQWKVVYQNSISTPDGKRCLVLIYDPSSQSSSNFSVQVLTL